MFLCARAITFCFERASYHNQGSGCVADELSRKKPGRTWRAHRHDVTGANGPTLISYSSEYIKITDQEHTVYPVFIPMSTVENFSPVKNVCKPSQMYPERQH
jgi:hypothetical protein